MDLNRNQFFFLGLVVLLLGLQLRFVSAYVLNPEATQFLAERSGEPATSTAASFFNSHQHAGDCPQGVATARMDRVVPDLGRSRADSARPGHEEAGRGLVVAIAV